MFSQSPIKKIIDGLDGLLATCIHSNYPYSFITARQLAESLAKFFTLKDEAILKAELTNLIKITTELEAETKLTSPSIAHQQTRFKKTKQSQLVFNTNVFISFIHKELTVFYSMPFPTNISRLALEAQKTKINEAINTLLTDTAVRGHVTPLKNAWDQFITTQKIEHLTHTITTTKQKIQSTINSQRTANLTIDLTPVVALIKSLDNFISSILHINKFINRCSQTGLITISEDFFTSLRSRVNKVFIDYFEQSLSFTELSARISTLFIENHPVIPFIKFIIEFIETLMELENFLLTYANEEDIVSGVLTLNNFTERLSPHPTNEELSHFDQIALINSIVTVSTRNTIKQIITKFKLLFTTPYCETLQMSTNYRVLTKQQENKLRTLRGRYLTDDGIRDQQQCVKNLNLLKLKYRLPAPRAFLDYTASRSTTPSLPSSKPSYLQKVDLVTKERLNELKDKLYKHHFGSIDYHRESPAFEELICNRNYRPPFYIAKLSTPLAEASTPIAQRSDSVPSTFFFSDYPELVHVRTSTPLAAAPPLFEPEFSPIRGDNNGRNSASSLNNLLDLKNAPATTAAASSSSSSHSFSIDNLNLENDVFIKTSGKPSPTESLQGLRSQQGSPALPHTDTTTQAARAASPVVQVHHYTKKYINFDLEKLCRHIQRPTNSPAENFNPDLVMSTLHTFAMFPPSYTINSLRLSDQKLKAFENYKQHPNKALKALTKFLEKKCGIKKPALRNYIIKYFNVYSILGPIHSILQCNKTLNLSLYNDECSIVSTKDRYLDITYTANLVPSELLASGDRISIKELYPIATTFTFKYVVDLQELVFLESSGSVQGIANVDRFISALQTYLQIATFQNIFTDLSIPLKLKHAV